MSNLSVNTITDVSGGSTASINGLTPQASNMQPFNRIINGAMTIDQWNAGASLTPVSGQFAVDRWPLSVSQASKLSTQQSTTAPSGFVNSLLSTITSSVSIGASDYFLIRQFIEGFNASDLGWGTANAQTITISFWVRSSLTGTFGGSLMNSVENRSYPFSYTISTSNTWEQKSVTIAGDTSGTWLTNNATGIQLNFSLGGGSSLSSTAGSWSGATYVSATGATSVVGTLGATFYITGVQLEAGSSASSFAHENYSDTLQKCQRYYTVGGQKDSSGSGATTSSTTRYGVTMRAAPALSFGNSPQGAGTVLPAGTDWISATEFSAYVSQPSINFSYTANAEL